MSFIPATKLLLRYSATATATYVEPSTALIHCLELAIERQSLKLTQQSHAQIMCWKLHQNPFIVTKLIISYATCQNPGQGKVVFGSVREKNVYLWNTLINGYVRNGEHEYAFQLFSEMCEGIVCPDDFTFSTLCKVSGEVGDIGVGKYVHGKCFRTGIALDVMTKNADKWKDRIGTQRKMVTEKLQKRAGNIKDRKEQKRERKIAKREKKLLRPGS